MFSKRFSFYLFKAKVCYELRLDQVKPQKFPDVNLNGSANYIFLIFLINPPSCIVFMFIQLFRLLFGQYTLLMPEQIKCGAADSWLFPSLYRPQSISRLKSID